MFSVAQCVNFTKLTTACYLANMWPVQCVTRGGPAEDHIRTSIQQLVNEIEMISISCNLRVDAVVVQCVWLIQMGNH